MGCWLALIIFLQVFSLLRALHARCRIFALDWAGTAEKGLRVVLGVGGGGPQVGSSVVLPLVEMGREASGWAILPRRMRLLFQGDVSS